MRIVMIGATGHVGSYLVPRLVNAGHQVLAVSRGQREPYHPDPAWDRVERLQIDRTAEEDSGTFGRRIADLEAEVVIDMVCFTAKSAGQLVEGLRGRVRQLLHCGTIWVHGLSTVLPMREDDPKTPIGDYGTNKLAIEELLLAETRSGGLASTIIHPGHISGPGWPVINPVGNLDPAVWTTLATGQSLLVPGLGAETMHHVHADDVAQLFQLALEKPDAALGESFHAVSERALTVRGYAEAAARWFGQHAQLEQVSWEEFRRRTDDQHAAASWDHLSRSQVASIDKARRLLGYQPAYSSDEAAREAVTWLVEAGQLDLGPRGALL
ncbi:NAD-dependent epimerase/dehydratase family protein [Microlunatus panaciterrae]|uniref:Nucleoside-diphosphate-sugar epimerase n=1 Tax=Microlunatus panaciterrae TaxID=400768 RepID=A0ABS2RQK5_9ACTN|nr:NAD-dependent epimerase/dehydratase family protein [Microlunatus panaciterrae]MBM7800446.1 nucleoside-diphosphate-sugar epimerase [Microlunatus panaciterrae]